MNHAWRLAQAAALSLLLAGGTAEAADLRIGVSALSTSVDPHFYNLAANVTLSLHLFDRLTQRAPDSTLQPGLALSWTPSSETVWEFRLRPGVTWSDGVPFTADDVAFTIERARNVPNSPSSFAGFLRAIVSTEIVDPLTVRFHTAGPAPNVPIDLATIAIVSRHAGQGARTDDYNTGKAAIGTGPYRLVSFERGNRAELVRNETWWGGKPEWEHVTFLGIPVAGPRIAALLAGDVDLVDAPPLSNLQQLKADKRVSVFEAQGLRLIFLGPDYTRLGAEPFIDQLNDISGVIGTNKSDQLTGRIDPFLGGELVVLEGRGGNNTITGPVDSATNTASNITHLLADRVAGKNTNIASYESGPSGVTVDLTDGVASNGWGGTDTLDNIRAAAGSAFDDTLIGSAENDVLRGNGGNNIIDGEGGINQADYSTAPSSVTVNLATGTAQNGCRSRQPRRSRPPPRPGCSRTARCPRVPCRSPGHRTPAGQNVLDGGLGSNYLTGGTGQDTFFTDSRQAGVVWNTIINFHAGDYGTLWGFTKGVSSYHWDDQLSGAPGAQGATLRANIVGGNGRTGDGIDASMTFAGLSVAQAKGVTVTTGTQTAGNYIMLYNNGV